VIHVWNRKVVEWDVAERDDHAIAADLLSRACKRERISKDSRQQLILHAENDNAISTTTEKTDGGTGRAQILLKAKGIRRQPLLGVRFPYREVPA
jgi:hypothetical protein